jgi:RTX calcium-binding nonapeptide repeat (4 copies)/Divergent InlB B-repeat domain
VTLTVLITGKDGVVSVPGAGDPCTRNAGDAGECGPYSFTLGEPVTLKPVAGTLFAWSLLECPGTGDCTFRMDGDRTVVATFTPTSLKVVVQGGDEDHPLQDDQGKPLQDDQGNPVEGKVTATSRDGKVSFTCSGSDSCFREDFEPFDQVTLTADPEGEFERWTGRDQDGNTASVCQEGDTKSTCTLLLSGDDVVGAKFEDDPDQPDVVPGRTTMPLSVAVEPAGAGKVTSSRSARTSDAIDCPATCTARFEQGETVSLTASDRTGSFVGWRDAHSFCQTRRTCTLPAYMTTSIQAVFQTQPQPPQPQPPGPQPPQPQPPQPSTPCSQQRVGTPAGDRLDGDAGGDRILGKAGNDRIRGLAGDDCLSGGSGNDTLKGGRGNDIVSGGAGADLLFGGPGEDRLNSGAGEDRIVAKDGGRDTIVCGAGRDVVVSKDAGDKTRGCERIRR